MRKHGKRTFWEVLTRSKALGQEQAWRFQGAEERSVQLGHSKYGMRIGTGIVEVIRGQRGKDLVGHKEV